MYFQEALQQRNNPPNIKISSLFLLCFFMFWRNDSRYTDPLWSWTCSNVTLSVYSWLHTLANWIVATKELHALIVLAWFQRSTPEPKQALQFKPVWGCVSRAALVSSCPRSFKVHLQQKKAHSWLTLCHSSARSQTHHSAWWRNSIFLQPNHVCLVGLSQKTNTHTSGTLTICVTIVLF